MTSPRCPHGTDLRHCAKRECVIRWNFRKVESAERAKRLARKDIAKHFFTPPQMPRSEPSDSHLPSNARRTAPLWYKGPSK